MENVASPFQAEPRQFAVPIVPVRNPSNAPFAASLSNPTRERTNRPNSPVGPDFVQRTRIPSTGLVSNPRRFMGKVGVACSLVQPSLSFVLRSLLRKGRIRSAERVEAHPIYNRFLRTFFQPHVRTVGTQ